MSNNLISLIYIYEKIYIFFYESLISLISLTALLEFKWTDTRYEIYCINITIVTILKKPFCGLTLMNNLTEKRVGEKLS